jgi:hypothetical protein
LTLRAESFNLFNHPNVGIPLPFPDFGPFFGRIVGVSAKLLSAPRAHRRGWA